MNKLTVYFVIIAMSLVFNYGGNCSIVEDIPLKYLDGVKAIHIYDVERKGGWYFQGGVLKLWQCNKEYLIHELAHHKNWMDGHKPNHGKTFIKAYKEIRNESSLL